MSESATSQHSGDRISALRNLFERQYGREPSLVARAPGRVNLIGEHTDYNDGYVFPVAIDRDTLVAARARTDRQMRVYSSTLRRASTWSLDAVESSSDQPWSNYVRGMVSVLAESGVVLTGADMAIASNLPLGAGLASSAALEMATATALLGITRAELPAALLPRLGQRVENEFVGVQSGIMDQFISALGQSGHALLLDCRDLSYELVPLPRGFVIGVADTGVKHGLVASEYNARRADCEDGVRLLRAALPDIRALRDVSAAQLTAYKHLLPERVARRCRHVVTEDARVLVTVEALRRGDLAAVGQHMAASHKSLREDYEVTIPELDVLVEAASRVSGVVGSRMTGGGFGGATVSLMERRAVTAWERAVRQQFRARFGRTISTFVTGAADGANVAWPDAGSHDAP